MKTTDKTEWFNHEHYAMLVTNNPESAKEYIERFQVTAKKELKEEIKPVVEDEEPTPTEEEAKKELRRLLTEKNIKFFPGAKFDKLMQIAKENWII